MLYFETIVVIDRGREWPIASLRDAQSMAMRLLAQQKYQGDAQLLRACNAIDRAVAGHQTPASAIHAFAEFARARGILATPAKTKARESFERMLGRPRSIA